MGSEILDPPVPDRAVPDRAVPDGAAADLAARLDRVPALARTPRTIEELPGGLTNRNYKVSTPEGSYVARVWSRGDYLAINRDHEHLNSAAAAQAGVGAPVIAYHPQDSLLVLGYIDGRTFGNDDVQDPANIPRIARACRQLHAGPRFAGDFDMFAIQARYSAVTAEQGFTVPAGYDALAPRAQAARRALAVRAEPTVPCNNDLLAANFIDDGTAIWLIDYEYSGNNDACFELGNIGGECGLSDDALAGLVTAYYGRPLRNKIARAMLLGIIGKYGWTLWGAIQAATSPIGFDFWSWAMERHEGAAAAMTSPAFARLLDDVARED
ncbi:MAG TPA: phosphotransferase [Streptosporangiaceae bacterium]|nr:phosphotransferase [Streptosporangiaceae bacterium]